MLLCLSVNGGCIIRSDRVYLQYSTQFTVTSWIYWFVEPLAFIPGIMFLIRAVVYSVLILKVGPAHSLRLGVQYPKHVLLVMLVSQCHFLFPEKGHHGRRPSRIHRWLKGWPWAALKLWLMATKQTSRLPNDWPNACTISMDSGSQTWHDTWARSECYCNLL